MGLLLPSTCLVESYDEVRDTYLRRYLIVKNNDIHVTSLLFFHLYWYLSQIPKLSNAITTRFTSNFELEW